MKTNNNNAKKLSIYYTAGYPDLESTLPIAKSLEQAGVDFLEIGIPYSDPVADGPVIQQSSLQSLKNGMSIKVLLEQLSAFKSEVHIPYYLMGYFNPILQFGVQKFCKKCQEVGVKGLIIPDLPIEVYKKEYQDIFKQYGISMVFLITPQTSPERIRQIDELSTSFIYLLSSNATTGKNLAIDENTSAYFKRIQAMQLKAPLVVGFGIHNKESFEKSVLYTDGAIIGTAFIKALNAGVSPEDFINTIREKGGN
ncbi:MAG TPA: tryptophan synthase subunit alpha [Candidatus Sphingobacterium stercoripullorum]|uniref:Tryptophan synthase alpha chain n=1 Tax=Candidatus Sphingobacterium stercoripullorum TaxID=2838759 RepID=A0A9D2AY63_9SPHI|nr:tryptophan synthase subunit alpha [Candidatus Sphingobacterium stercoripullorum]HLR49054.1 tryptophan synthase subunit alpha [Candidatus Sphingobacterium stercoripullorum]